MKSFALSNDLGMKHSRNTEVFVSPSFTKEQTSSSVVTQPEFYFHLSLCTTCHTCTKATPSTHISDSTN